jgi:hypothetical protein
VLLHERMLLRMFESVRGGFDRENATQSEDDPSRDDLPVEIISPAGIFTYMAIFLRHRRRY